MTNIKKKNFIHRFIQCFFIFFSINFLLSILYIEFLIMDFQFLNSYFRFSIILWKYEREFRFTDFYFGDDMFM